MTLGPLDKIKILSLSQFVWENVHSDCQTKTLFELKILGKGEKKIKLSMQKEFSGIAKLFITFLQTVQPSGAFIDLD